MKYLLFFCGTVFFAQSAGAIEPGRSRREARPEIGRNELRVILLNLRSGSRIGRVPEEIESERRALGFNTEKEAKDYNRELDNIDAQTTAYEAIKDKTTEKAQKALATRNLAIDRLIETRVKAISTVLKGKKEAYYEPNGELSLSLGLVQELGRQGIQARSQLDAFAGSRPTEIRLANAISQSAQRIPKGTGLRESIDNVLESLEANRVEGNITGSQAGSLTSLNRLAEALSAEASGAVTGRRALTPEERKAVSDMLDIYSLVGVKQDEMDKLTKAVENPVNFTLMGYGRLAKDINLNMREALIAKILERQKTEEKKSSPELVQLEKELKKKSTSELMEQASKGSKETREQLVAELLTQEGFSLMKRNLDKKNNPLNVLRYACGGMKWLLRSGVKKEVQPKCTSWKDRLCEGALAALFGAGAAVATKQVVAAAKNHFEMKGDSVEIRDAGAHKKLFDDFENIISSEESTSSPGTPRPSSDQATTETRSSDPTTHLVKPFGGRRN